MAKKQKLSIKEQLRRAAQRPGGGRPTKTHTVFIGADLDVIEQYEQALAELEKLDESGDSAPQRGRRLSDPSSRTAVEARIEALREQLEEYAVDFRLRGLDDKTIARLEAEHPPRKGADGEVVEDDRGGLNAATFPRAIIRQTVISPEMDDEDWLMLLGDDENPGQLTHDQIDRMAGLGYRLSKLAVDVPFWRAASATTRSS